MIRFWLAMDHSRTEIFTSNGGGDVRPDLASVANEAGWGIVTGLDDRASQAQGDPELTCLGLPDLFGRRAVESLNAPPTCLASIKVGFGHVDGWGCDVTARAILDRTSGFSKHYLEPYCLVQACLRALYDVVETSKGAITLKLAADRESIRAISAAGTIHDWMARSDGIPWNSFYPQLGTARDFGCAGAMVGRALWGDTVSMSGSERRALILHRMELIERMLSKPSLS